MVVEPQLPGDENVPFRENFEEPKNYYTWIIEEIPAEFNKRKKNKDRMSDNEGFGPKQMAHKV